MGQQLQHCKRYGILAGKQFLLLSIINFCAEQVCMLLGFMPQEANNDGLILSLRSMLNHDWDSNTLVY